MNGGLLLNSRDHVYSFKLALSSTKFRSKKSFLSSAVIRFRKSCGQIKYIMQDEHQVVPELHSTAIDKVTSANRLYLLAAPWSGKSYICSELDKDVGCVYGKILDADHMVRDLLGWQNQPDPKASPAVFESWAGKMGNVFVDHLMACGGAILSAHAHPVILTMMRNAGIALAYWHPSFAHIDSEKFYSRTDHSEYDLSGRDILKRASGHLEACKMEIPDLIVYETPLSAFKVLL